MGGEESKLQQSREREKERGDSNQSKELQQAPPQINLNRPGIVVVSAAPEKHDLKITPVNKIEQKEDLDPLLDQLQQIPNFLPLVKQSIKGWDKLPQYHPFQIEPLQENTLDLCRRYQTYLRRTANIAAQEQKVIATNLKKLEVIAGRTFSSFSIKASETKKYEVKFREVGALAKCLFDIKLRLESVTETMKRLNSLLPEGKRLEPIVCGNDVDKVKEKIKEVEMDSGEKYPCSGITAKQGPRPTMEDTHVIFDSLFSSFPNLSQYYQEPLSFYAVYDGHGGIRTANLAQKILHKAVVESTEFSNKNIHKALDDAFHYTDSVILEKSAEEKWRDGSTAVVSLIVGNTIYVANAGDSEAVLSKRVGNGKWESILLSKKHSPAEPSEKHRIEKAGGGVFYGRVCGSLAVSRALGDLDFKEKPFVIATPFINETTFNEDNENLIIACDGLWDVLTYNEAAEFVGIRRYENNMSAQQVSLELVDHALKKGSTDNVSVIIVYLQPVRKAQQQ